MLVSVALLVFSLGLVSLMDTELIPAMDEGTVSISASMRPGTKVSLVEERMARLEDMVASHEDVESYTMTASDGSGSISVNLKDDRNMSSQEIADQWTEETKDFTDMQLEISTSSTISSMMTSGSGGSVTLTSTDLEDLQEAVAVMEEVSWNIPGVLNVSSSAGESSTQVRVLIDPLNAMSYGMTPAQAAGSLYSMISGTEAMTVTSNGQEYSVVLEYPEGTYTNADSLMDANVSGIPLSEIASLEYTNSQQTVTREDGAYVMTVSATCLSEDTDAVQAEMDRLAEEEDFPDSVEISVNTMDEMMNESFRSLGLALAAAIFLVFLVMAMQFESPRYSLMVMLSIPFSLIGSFGLLFLSGSSFSMISLMGVLMLAGIVVNNGILYVDGVNLLRTEMALEDALIESAKTRLRPILITTLTTIISMVPGALGIGEGNQMMQGMYIIIIGGLVASTLLILILMPVFYLIFYGRKYKKSRK